MKVKTVLATIGGVIVGAVAGVAMCTTEFGQQKILIPAMAGMERFKHKFSKEDEEVEEQLEEGDRNPGAEEHVEE